MGDIAEMMLDGTLCQQCGSFIDETEPGYPRTCDYCISEDKPKKPNKKKNTE